MRSIVIMIVGMVLLLGTETKKTGATEVPVFQSYCGSYCYSTSVGVEVSYQNKNNTIGGSEFNVSSNSPYSFESASGGGSGASAVADLPGDHLYVAAGVPNYSCGIEL